MIQLRPSSSVFEAVAHARSVVATAYVLQGRMLRALEDAARRGACVVVRVEGRPFDDSRGGMKRLNEDAVQALKRAGADARLVDKFDGTQPVMHMKAVVCDGVAYLDDRNFTSSGDEIVLRDDRRADVDAIVATANGRPHAALRSFSATKEQAIDSEMKLLVSAEHAREVDVETESFSFDGPAYAQLKKLASSGVLCRLIVSKRELDANGKRAVAILERSGVKVRAADFNGKVAIVDGKRAWVGSANATSAYYDGNQSEWAVRTRAKALVCTLQLQFDAHWRTAKLM